MGLPNYSLPVGTGLRMKQLSSSPHGDLCLPSTFLMDRTSLSCGSFHAWAAGRIWLFMSRGDSRFACLRLNQPAATAFKKLYNQGEFVPNWNFSNLLFLNIISVAVAFKSDSIYQRLWPLLCQINTHNSAVLKWRRWQIYHRKFNVLFLWLRLTKPNVRLVSCFYQLRRFLRWLESHDCVQNTILSSPLMNSLNNLQMTAWWRM